MESERGEWDALGTDSSSRLRLFPLQNGLGTEGTTAQELELNRGRPVSSLIPPSTALSCSKLGVELPGKCSPAREAEPLAAILLPSASAGVALQYAAGGDANRGGSPTFSHQELRLRSGRGPRGLGDSRAGGPCPGSSGFSFPRIWICSQPLYLILDLEI